MHLCGIQTQNLSADLGIEPCSSDSVFGTALAETPNSPTIHKHKHATMGIGLRPLCPLLHYSAFNNKNAT